MIPDRVRNLMIRLLITLISPFGRLFGLTKKKTSPQPKAPRDDTYPLF